MADTSRSRVGKKERQRAVKLEVTQRVPLLKYPSGG